MKDFGLFQTANLQMMNLLETAASLANTNASVLISGEQGSGKSLLVQYLVSTAQTHKKVELYQENTEPEAGDWVLIEGIESLHFQSQDEISRKMEQLRQRNIPVRWLATSNFTGAQLLAQNKIKKDLFYRLSVLQLEIPSLRQRSEDIEVLAQFFVQVFSLMNSQKSATLSQAAILKLRNHSWLGNVAELENVIERAVALNKAAVIGENLIQFPQVPETTKILEGVGTTLSEMEKKLILQTLQLTQQNKTRAAQILGISIRTLRNKLNEYREIGVI